MAEVVDIIDEGDAPAILPLPLGDWHRAAGARMCPFAGYEMPIQYDGIVPEHLWTRGHAGLFDVSHMGQLLLSGPGVAEALETLLPADVKGLGAGRMRYSLLLADGGGILDDLMLTHVGDAAAAPAVFADDGEAADPGPLFYMVVNGATKHDDIAHLRDRLPDEVTINHMDEQALLALQGPEAAATLARLVPTVAELGFMQAGAFVLDGAPAWISRSGYTGEDGFEISVPADAVARIATLLAAQPEVKPIGLGARDSLRLEAGLPLYGHDLDEDTTPVAADLGFALSKRRREEGGFPAADRILAEREAGPALKRVGLLVDGRQPVREGATVVDAGGAEVGRVTSGGHSPTLGRAIAMAYLPLADAASGTRVRLMQRGKIHEAEVAPMPFVPHRYHRKGA